MLQECSKATITHRKGNESKAVEESQSPTMDFDPFLAVTLLAHPTQGLGLSWLEPHAVKIARVVLRGVGGGNSARLRVPDMGDSLEVKVLYPS